MNKNMQRMSQTGKRSSRASKKFAVPPAQRSRHVELKQDAAKQFEECTADAQSAQEELESFCYSVSHDLRAPLRCIDGFSHAMLHEFGETLEPAAREYLQRIVESAKKMARLIDELLVLSRIQRAEFNPEEFNITEMAENIAARLKRSEPERSVRFLAKQDVMVYGDKALMTLALEKLLDNAWKFTSKTPSPVIEFSESINDSQPALFVRDNGAGFNPAYSAKLFKAFQRLHSQTDFPGVGAGLAIARTVILRHRGRIWAESNPGEGATFFFTLGLRNRPRTP
jgi:light-regulated signal transduction histidine kinase (bacteriophytochrome)